jgi:hypothetical protein
MKKQTKGKNLLRLLTSLVLVGIFGWGCGAGESFLEGSISKRFGLGFDFVNVRQDGGALVVRYQDRVEFVEVGYEAENTVAELVFEELPDREYLGVWMDVSQTVELNRYVIIMPEKYLITQDERRFPEVHLAEIVFTELGTEAGQAVSGQFHVTFVDGSTLRGGFSAAL